MTRWTRLGPEDALRQPWRNGRGMTRQFALWPAHARFEAGDFDWRISAAGVVEDGPFSTFKGFDRVLVVTEGEGLVLEQASARTELRPFEPRAFSGDSETRGSLVAGPVQDFGVMTRRGVWRAEVAVVRSDEGSNGIELSPREHGFLHVLGGSIDARLDGARSPHSVVGGESLWARPSSRSASLAWESADAIVIAVRLAPA